MKYYYVLSNCLLLFMMLLSCCGGVDTVYNRVKRTPKHLSKGSSMSLQRLSALRALMSSQPKAISAYIVQTADEHNSEYISPTDARREWISGFTGSAGTAVVTDTKALMWTDGRYYTQFEKEVDMGVWTLMKQSLPETPSMEKWLTSNLVEGAVVGADPTTMRRNDWTPLKTALTRANMELVAINMNLVDEVRREMADPPPRRPSNDLVPLPLKYTGKSAGQKISELRKQMVERKASALVVTALDEVAYTLNLRGSDIEYNPVFFSYLLITADEVIFFWHNGILSDDVKTHFLNEKVTNVICKPYSEAFKTLEDLAKDYVKTGTKHVIWLSHDASEAIHTAATGGNSSNKQLMLISEVSPVAIAKLTKNEVELKGFRECHIRDGVAVIRFFRWLHSQLKAGSKVTEVQAADKLLEFRKDENDFVGPSFSTIAGAGPNGAIIHYTASRDGPQTVIRGNDMFLLDSGGQYRDGTTDITRTRHMSGSPTQEEKNAFTRVLKGQIMMGSALFPKGVKGNVLDSLARWALWCSGQDYGHGTGHGVGHYLNVHEEPTGISWRPYADDPGLTPGAVLSNEPGFYKVGSFGIRHEDLVEVIAVDNKTNHPRASGLVDDFSGRGVLGFHTLTMVPHQRDCVQVDLMDDFELNYLNSYHARVLSVIGPVLKERGLNEDFQWLQNECRPIVRDIGKHQ